MLDISNKTQEQIEELFSQDNYNQELAIAVYKFVQKIPQSSYDIMQQITKYNEDEVDTLMNDLIVLVGSKRNGLPMSEDYPHVREFSAEQMVLSIARLLVNHSQQESYVVAMDIVAEFDTIFWDITQEHKQSEEGNWYTSTSIIVDFEVSSQAEKLSGYKRFKLPLIEQPIDWNTNSNEGGYHLDSGKVTLNKGAKEQPQEVLDVLNKLQHQQYTLRAYDIPEQYKYALAKIQDKNWKSDESAHVKSANVLFQTVQETYETMQDKVFSLAWKYDFRLRAYSVGYDINIQGASYQKAMLKPVFIKGEHYNKGN